MIKRWLKKRREAIEQRKYEDGFGWACTEILLKGTPAEEVEAYVFGQITSFDLGAQEALRQKVGS